MTTTTTSLLNPSPSPSLRSTSLPSPTPSLGSKKIWRFFGRRVPQNEIVFFFQVILIYIVVGVSLFNLSQGRGPDHLWVALLGSSLGYVLPNPSIS